MNNCIITMHTILGEISLHLQSLESVRENNLKGNFPDSNLFYHI